MNKLRSTTIILLLALLVGFGLMGCQVDELQKGRKPSADWSKGYPLNVDTDGDFAVKVDSAENRVHVIFPSGGDGGFNNALYYQQMDAAGVVTPPQLLIESEGRLRQPVIEQRDDGLFSLIWIDRPDGAPVWTLMRVDFDHSGQLVSDPQPLTAEPFNISGYQSTDQLIVFEDRPTGGLYGLDWQNASAPVQLVDDAELPMLSADGNTTHFAWVVDDSLYYSELDLAQPLNGQFLTQLESTVNDSLETPSLVATDDWIYVFWAIYRNTGLEAGTGFTAYVAFPKGEARPMSFDRVWIYPMEEPPVGSYTSNFPITELVPSPSIASQTTRYVQGTDAIAGDGNEVALAVSATQQLRLNTSEQIAIAFFADGAYTGFQWAGKTTNLSQNGKLERDQANNLHLFWQEGATGGKLFYATIDPARREIIDAVNRNDIANGALNGMMDMLIGIMFFPAAMAWLLPGVLILLIYQWNRDYAILDHWQPIGITVVAFITYLFAKMVTLPAIFSYAPLTAWFDISAWLATFLQYGTPFLSALIALVIAESRRRRNDTMAPLNYFLVAASADAVITLALYGVNFMGVF